MRTYHKINYKTGVRQYVQACLCGMILRSRAVGHNRADCLYFRRLPKKTAVIPEKLILAKVGSGNNKERELSFWNTFALLSINHVLSVANVSAKNLAKMLNYLSGRSFGRFALSRMTMVFFKHFWKCGVDYP